VPPKVGRRATAACRIPPSHDSSRQDRVASPLRSADVACTQQSGNVESSHCSFQTLAHNSGWGSVALLIRTSEIEQPHRVTPA
jgi:hypothetical protein